MDTPEPTSQRPAEASIEQQISAVGGRLSRSLTRVIDALPGPTCGPQALARTLHIDKVLSSRLLKAARTRDPLSVVHLMPGPEPVRRALKAAAREGVDSGLINEATAVVSEFEHLIRVEVGDRASLDAILSAWLPDARREFELRRKQSAFKAMSHLIGADADATVATVILHPSVDGANMDVLWISGMLGLQRIRPGVAVKFTTRRITPDRGPRHPLSLDGKPVDDLQDIRLDEFCSDPPPTLEVHRSGDVMHYHLPGNGFGRRSAVDYIFAEVNLAEIPRFVPPESKRKGYVFAEVNTPVKTLHFDVLVHRDIYPGSDPQLFMYDTVLEGVADVNDPSRDNDRLDLMESIQHLGVGIDRFRSSDVPNYGALLRFVCDRMKWDGGAFRGYRCQVDYPIYGSQVVMAFDPPSSV